MAASTEVLDFSLGPYRLEVPISYGPRVLGLRLANGPQLFARLDPGVAIDRPEGPPYRFRGGHRLWAGPENPPLTYAPDDHHCEVARGPETLRIVGPVDAAGMGKEMVINRDGGDLVIEHVLSNQSQALLRVAPWAITQFRLGGVALMPVASCEPGGLQADRSLSLWPYTDLSDSRLHWRQAGVAIEARPGPPVKLGAGPNPARLGYFIDGCLFVKYLPPPGAGEYQDRGAVGQVYLDHRFCELESVGEVAFLSPGDSVRHSERWIVEPCTDLGDAQTRMGL
jgi:hypothetical protein